jgi:hypothetical protein
MSEVGISMEFIVTERNEHNFVEARIVKSSEGVASSSHSPPCGKFDIISTATQCLLGDNVRSRN